MSKDFGFGTPSGGCYGEGDNSRCGCDGDDGGDGATGVSVKEAEGAEGVFILQMKANENRFNPDFMNALHQALDYVEKYAYVHVDDGSIAEDVDLTHRSYAGTMVPRRWS